MKKTVIINIDKNQVYKLVKWDFAYREARKSDFQKTYLDRLRFQRRILDCESNLNYIFNKNHRDQVYFERFNVNNL